MLHLHVSEQRHFYANKAQRKNRSAQLLSETPPKRDALPKNEIGNCQDCHKCHFLKQLKTRYTPEYEIGVNFGSKFPPPLMCRCTTVAVLSFWRLMSVMPQLLQGYKCHVCFFFLCVCVFHVLLCFQVVQLNSCK